MDLFIGYAGIALTFVIMMTILLMILIKANNISWKLKLLVIPMVLWYSVALYHVPGNFMGWPTEKWQVQNQVIVLDYKIDEEEAIYFWVVDYNLKNVRFFADPRNTYYPFVDDTPRAYKIVYNSELHKQLVEARNKRKRLGRGSMMMRMDRLQGLSTFGEDNEVFDIFDPAQVLRKAETQRH